jgi:hypothetical protein
LMLTSLSVVVVITLANLMSRNCSACSPNESANPGMTHSGTDQCAAAGAYTRSYGKLCGNGPDLWLRLQATYDAREASKRLKREVAKIPTLR